MPKKAAAKTAKKASKAKAAKAPKKAATKAASKAPVETKAAKPKKEDSRRCKIENCPKTYRAKGYCDNHYKKWRRGEYGTARYKICSAKSCRAPKVLNFHGYCEEHFKSIVRKIKQSDSQAAPPAEGEQSAEAS